VNTGRSSMQASYIVAQFSKDHAFDRTYFSCSISSIALIMDNDGDIEEQNDDSLL
jgi:hypothetical protein